MRDRDLNRRQFLLGSSAAAGALLIPPTRASPPPRPAMRVIRSEPTGATVAPRVYGMNSSITSWVRTAKRFDSYIGRPLATKLQKIYLAEGQYFTDPLPFHITSLAGVGCHFIVCFTPSRTIDQRAELARCLRLLKDNGIVFQAALDNEWNCSRKFPSAQAYLRYWHHYAPVVKAAGVPLCTVVLASSTHAQYKMIEPGFPRNPLPDGYWIDYYATAYQWKVRLDNPGGLLHQASRLGVPAGIAEFGIGAHGRAPIPVWDEFCHYLAGLAPHLPLGCLYFGSVSHGWQNVVTGPHDPKVPGIQRVMKAFREA